MFLPFVIFPSSPWAITKNMPPTVKATIAIEPVMPKIKLITWDNIVVHPVFSVLPASGNCFTRVILLASLFTSFGYSTLGTRLCAIACQANMVESIAAISISFFDINLLSKFYCADYGNDCV